MAVTFRMWQLHVREVEQRADVAERTKDEAARRRAMEERLRIARELHDSLTHSISVIQVQAGVAVHLARKRGEDVPPALLAIQEAGTDAVRELRATLGVLRSEEDGDGSGLCQLDSLVARARAAGLPVTVTVTGVRAAASARGGPGCLPDRAGSAHQREPSRRPGARRFTCTTRRTRSDDSGRRRRHGTVTSNGTRAPGPGLGLVGMRERVSALGGRLQAGPQDGGGFRVRAELPARASS